MSVNMRTQAYRAIKKKEKKVGKTLCEIKQKETQEYAIEKAPT